MALKTKAPIQNTYLYSLLLLTISALLTSANQVFYAKQVQTINPITFTFISFLLCMIMFQTIHYLKKDTSKNSKTSYRDIVLLNISTVVAFVSFYFALKYIEPAVVSAIEMGLAPFFLLVFSTWLYPSRKASVKDYFISAGVLTGSLFLYWTTINGQSGLGVIPGDTLFKGISAALSCSIGAVFATIYSKRLSNQGWHAEKIMAHRFYAIIIFSALFASKSLPNVLINHWEWILIASIAGVILPLYLMQIGIQFCDPFVVMMSICLIPIFTFFFQLFDPRIVWSTQTLFGILLLTFATGLSMYQKK
ncbi:DMT family transporter [Bacillus solimangrovi]|uniref:EamA domain-containing protein n=1 Tax=Bacillus solimangrovi TaxID=1305675 RepID=A0A1E5LES9_9BACI|nr:DMT family transporter [Bacillus solimangrovi]OEH92579.1 hypothetical protein BFG57_14950 [Bacillus solimangrovi]